MTAYVLAHPFLTILVYIPVAFSLIFFATLSVVLLTDRLDEHDSY